MTAAYASYPSPGQYPGQPQVQASANMGYQQGFVGPTTAQPQQPSPMAMAQRFPMPGAPGAMPNNPYGMGQRFNRYPQAPGYR